MLLNIDEAEYFLTSLYKLKAGQTAVFDFIDEGANAGIDKSEQLFSLFNKGDILEIVSPSFAGKTPVCFKFISGNFAGKSFSISVDTAKKVRVLLPLSKRGLLF